MGNLLDATATAARLPFAALVAAIESLLVDPAVRVAERLVQPLPGGGSLFVMPAADGRIATTKLITYTPANAGTARPAIQGDVVVFDVTTGERLFVLDGPTVTARRTAAVSLLAAQRLAPRRDGRMLIVGAGAQGRAHLEAFHASLGRAGGRRLPQTGERAGPGRARTDSRDAGQHEQRPRSRAG